MSDLREKLADQQHDIWSHWMRWQFSVCRRTEGDGSLVIPADLVERWTRQMNTPYAELSEKEKDSDRDQADKIRALLLREKEMQVCEKEHAAESKGWDGDCG